MDKVTSAAQALQAQAESVTALEARVSELEAEVDAAGGTLAAAKADSAVALRAADARHEIALGQVATRKKT